jgi:hypothetical protein
LISVVRFDIHRSTVSSYHAVCHQRMRLSFQLRVGAGMVHNSLAEHKNSHPLLLARAAIQFDDRNTFEQ